MRGARILAGVFLLGFSLAANPPVHILDAKGAHGWIKYWGDGSVHVSGRGRLTIQNACNQRPEVKGTWGEMQTLADGAEYTHFEGSVDSVGLGMHFEMRGWDLAISAKGRGKAWFRGEGTAAVDSETPRPWQDDPEKWLKVDFRK